MYLFKGTFIEQDKVMGVEGAEGVGKPWGSDATEYVDPLYALIFKNAAVVLAATSFFSILKDWQLYSYRKILKSCAGQLQTKAYRLDRLEGSEIDIDFLHADCGLQYP